MNCVMNLMLVDRHLIYLNVSHKVWIDGEQSKTVALLCVLQKDGVSCHYCCKVFGGRNKNQDYKRHLLSHTGERPFSCPYCPYRAALKGNLKKHVMTHEKIETFARIFDAASLNLARINTRPSQ